MRIENSSRHRGSRVQLCATPARFARSRPTKFITPARSIWPFADYHPTRTLLRNCASLGNPLDPASERETLNLMKNLLGEATNRRKPSITYLPAKIHWTYFTALEQDVETLARYVEPIPDNFDTYSLEICRILFSACSECEVVLKMLAARNGTNTKRYDLDRLRTVITVQYPEITQEKVYLRRYGLELDPWLSWKSRTTPAWWTGYNKVKHHRASNYPHGNLENALNAVAALMVSVVIYYRYEMSPPGQPIVFPDVFEALAPESRSFFFSESRYPSVLRIN